MRTQAERTGNLGDPERLALTIAGGALLVFGVSRVSLRGVLLVAIGSALGYRGITGRSLLYDGLGIDLRGGQGWRAIASRKVGNLGVKIDESIVVNAPPQRVYGIWRNLENLPRLLSNVERVEILDRTRSRWTVKGPAGTPISWDAELINDKPGEIIAWRTIDSSLVNHAGSVRFEPVAQGTRVDVSLQYDPPGGRFGHAVASLVSADAGTQTARDLEEFKRAVEDGRLAA